MGNSDGSLGATRNLTTEVLGAQDPKNVVISPGLNWAGPKPAFLSLHLLQHPKPLEMTQLLPLPVAGGGAADVCLWQPRSLFSLPAANLLEGLPSELPPSEKQAGKQSHAQTSSEPSCGNADAARCSRAGHKFLIRNPFLWLPALSVHHTVEFRSHHPNANQPLQGSTKSVWLCVSLSQQAHSQPSHMPCCSLQN